MFYKNFRNENNEINVHKSTIIIKICDTNNEVFYMYIKFHIKKYLKIEENINLFSIIPKYYIELLGVISFIVVFKILIINNNTNAEIILILGVFAASALKLLPSFNRIINSIVRVKYSYSSVNLIHDEINLKKFLYKKFI